MYLQDFDPEFLPYNKDIFEKSDLESENDISIWLTKCFCCKGSRVSKVFNFSKGSSEEINLIGKNKLDFIKSNFGKTLTILVTQKMISLCGKWLINLWNQY